MGKNYFLGFKNGKLVTVVISEYDEVENAIDADYYVDHPQDPEKQVDTWLKQG